MKLSLILTTLALCTLLGASVSAQPFGIDPVENMQKKQSSCIELSEDKEEEIKIVVQKLTDHLRQVMQEHKNFDFKLIKLNIEEHKDTHTTENDTVLQLIVNDCARENENNTKTDEKSNRSNITKVEPKKDDEEAKRHDLSSNGTAVSIKDSKIQPNHVYNNQPIDLTKNKEQPSELNPPSFNHGEANLDKKPSIKNLTDSSKPLSNNHGPNFGKKPLDTDKTDTVLNVSKKTNENMDKLNDTKKPLFNNHGPNFGKKPIATDRRDNVTSDPKKNNENTEILKDIKPLSNNHGQNFPKQPLATDKKDNVTNGSKKDSENAEATVKSPFNKDGATPDKNKDGKPGEIDKKKDVIDGISKKNDEAKEEKNNEKETKKPEIEPKINQKNETHFEMKKNEDQSNVTKPTNDKKNEKQMKKPGTHNNETQADDNRDKKLTQLILPENAEKLLRALERNRSNEKPIWIYLEDKEDEPNIVFF